jgi:hypothetical protein
LVWRVRKAALAGRFVYAGRLLQAAMKLAATGANRFSARLPAAGSWLVR